MANNLAPAKDYVRVTAMETASLRTKKRWVLYGALAAFFLMGVVAGFFPEESQAADIISVAGALICLLLAYSWWVFDSLEQRFTIGPIMKIGLVLFFIIAFIVYLFKTRGTKAFWPLGLAVLFFFLCFGVSVLGSFLTLLGRQYFG